MKVLMVTPFYYPILGGSETQIENLSLKFNEIGLPTDIITFNFNEAEQLMSFEKIEKINGLKVIRVPAFNILPSKLHHNKINFMVNLIPRKFTQIFEEYDILHFHNETDLSFPVFSYSVKKPKVFHLRCLNVTYPIFKRNFICRRLLRNIADIYIAQSKYVSSLLMDLGIPSSKLKIIPNAINVSAFKPGKQGRISNMLLYVGRIEEYKGLHILLKSLEHICKPVQLSIIGPFVGEPSYHQKIVKLITKINEKTVHKVMYLGPKKPQEILGYYQTASIVVVPSLSESFGNVILESLACETPVIASNVGGIPEIITNYKNGILVPPGNDVKLGEAIRFLLSDEDTRRRFGKQGRKTVVEKFSFDATVKELLEVYNKLLN